MPYKFGRSPREKMKDLKAVENDFLAVLHGIARVLLGTARQSNSYIKCICDFSYIAT
jgi:hypothetical protein